MQARWFRHLLNVYPPFLGAGIRVRHIAADWRRVQVEMALRWYNRNAVGELVAKVRRQLYVRRKPAG